MDDLQYISADLDEDWPGSIDWDAVLSLILDYTVEA
jgi:hypothetical protein